MGSRFSLPVKRLEQYTAKWVTPQQRAFSATSRPSYWTLPFPISRCGRCRRAFSFPHFLYRRARLCEGTCGRFAYRVEETMDEKKQRCAFATIKSFNNPPSRPSIALLFDPFSKAQLTTPRDLHLDLRPFLFSQERNQPPPSQVPAAPISL